MNGYEREELDKEHKASLSDWIIGGIFVVPWLVGIGLIVSIIFDL